MTAPRLAYDDAATPAQMRADCLAVQASLTVPLSVVAGRLSQEQPKRDIEFSAAAARLASAMNLQLDGDLD